MKLKLSYLLAAATISTAIGTHAQEATKPERPSREEMREKMKNMTPEERQKQIDEWRAKQGQGGGQASERRPDMEQALKELGLKQEDLRNLTPEERRAKMGEAMDKKIAELNKKKASKTITEEETKFLTKLEARKKWAADRAKEGPRKEGDAGKDGPKKDGKEHHKDDHKDHKDDHKPSKDDHKPGKGDKHSGDKGEKPAPKK